MLKQILLSSYLVLALAPVARAWEPFEDDAAERAREAAGLPERDDPAERLRARLQRFGPRSPEDSARILKIAEAESARLGLHASTGLRRAAASATAAVQGNAWINIGPTGAAYEKNGVPYSKTDSGRINTIAPHPIDPNVVYLATSGGGVWKTFDALTPVTYSTGPHWTPIFDAVGALAVGAMAVDTHSPDDLIVGLGDPFDVHVAGLVTSVDGGATWSPSVQLTGTYPGNGSWTASSVRDIRFDGDGNGTALAATDAGLFIGGVSASWRLVDLAADHSPQACWSAAWVGSGNWLVACENEGGQGTIFRSGDGGASWASVVGGFPASVQTRLKRMTIAAAGDGQRVYVLAAADDIVDPIGGGNKRWGTLDLFRSDDGGHSFRGVGLNNTNVPTNPNADQTDLDVMHDQAWYNQMLVIDPRHRDTVLVGGNLSMVRSTDGGNSWSVMSNWLPWSPANPQAKNVAYVHADWHAAALSYAGDRATFYGGTDGGIFRSTDVLTASAGTATFEDGLNRGIVTHLVYYLATDETNSGNTLVFGGLQDNGTRLRGLTTDTAPSGPQWFNQVVGGDGIGVGAGKQGNSTVVGSLLFATTPGNVYRSQDSGANFAPAMGGLPADSTGSLPGGNFYMLLATDFGDAHNKTFLTRANLSDGGHVYRWVDTGSAVNSWTEITGGTTVALRGGGTQAFTTDWIGGLACDPKHSGQYGAVAYDRAYVRAPGSTTWTQSAATPLAYLTSISFDPATLGTYWVASGSSSSGGHVYKTVDGGATWLNAQGAGLPDVPANVVKVDPNDANTVYLGTEIGLYRTTDGGQHWARYGTGLPLVSVTDLSVALDSTAIRASTFGRGFWEIYPSFSAPVGVHGNGDFDRNQQIDGFDLIGIAGVLGTTTRDANYDNTGNLVGSTNAVDADDLAALIAKIGGRP